MQQYVTQAEVQRVCGELGLQNWTTLSSARIPTSEAEIVRTAVGNEALKVSVESFHRGLEVELEHGVVYPDSNVTNNHPILTGRIVVAHLKESMDYYERLEVAELEADLVKAIKAGNPEKTTEVYQRLTEARGRLAETESATFDGSDV